MILEETKRVTPTHGPKPAGRPDRCFYCHRMVGQDHTDDCVMYERTVVLRATIEYVVRVPKHWDVHQIEFYRNEGSWCGSNGIDELERIKQKRDEKGACMCSMVSYEYVDEADTDTEDPGGKS